LNGLIEHDSLTSSDKIEPKHKFLFKLSLMLYYIAITLSVRPSVRLSIRSHFRNRYLGFYWKKWFYIWYMALAWWLVPCLPFPGLPHIYFLFTVRLRIFHVCRNENFRNNYLSFYWKKWFYIWYMALAWWLVPCLPFPGLPHIYFLFTLRLTNERVGVFLARCSVQHNILFCFRRHDSFYGNTWPCYFLIVSD
jgi:hypothetical protein